MFIRFVVGVDAEHHRSLTGIITQSRLLRDKGGLNGREKLWLEEIYRWFNANVSVPPFSTRKLPQSAVCWLRDDAGERRQKDVAVVIFLKHHGLPVRMLRSRNPGKILYQDSHQIVVEEWKKVG